MVPAKQTPPAPKAQPATPPSSSFSATKREPNAAAAAATPSSSSAKATKSLSDKIAIVGGGPSGLFVARELSRKGYTDVTVFEQSGAPAGGIVRSTLLDGKIVDLTTRFVSPLTPNGPAMQPALQQMITQYNLSTFFVMSDLTYVDISGSSPFIRGLTPPVFDRFFAQNQQGLVLLSMIQGFEILRAIYNTATIAQCRQVLGISSAMTFGEWASNPALGGGLEPFVDFAAFTNDAFLGGPSFDQDVCVFLRGRAHYMVVDIVAVLKFIFQLSDQSTFPPMSAELKSLLAPGVNPRRQQFTNGFATLFNAIAANEGFTLELNTEVKNVKVKDGKLRITRTGGADEDFDKVIFAARPWDIEKLVDDVASNTVTSLLDEAFATSVHIAATTTTGTAAIFGTSAFSSALYPPSEALVTNTMPTSTYGLNRQFDGDNVVVGLAYGTDDPRIRTSFSEGSFPGWLDIEFDQAVEAMGLTPTGRALELSVKYPVAIPVAQVHAQWYDQLESQQGVNNLYYVGETLAGPGVHPILDHSINFVNTHF